MTESRLADRMNGLLPEAAFIRVARQIMDGLIHPDEPWIHFCSTCIVIYWGRCVVKRFQPTI